MNPVKHTQVPLNCAVPRPLQVTALLYWQFAPAKPALQVQVPVEMLQLPAKLQWLLLVHWADAALGAASTATRTTPPKNRIGRV